MIRSIFKFLLSALFLFSGFNHFLNPQIFLKIMPPYLPLHLELIYISGFFEILCGICLWFSKTQKLAAWGIVLMLIAFFPVHIYMWLNPENFPDIPESLLLGRLLLQFPMIYWAYVYTKVSKSNSSASI